MMARADSSTDMATTRAKVGDDEQDRILKALQAYHQLTGSDKVGNTEECRKDAIVVTLVDRDLWNKFHQLTNEMILTGKGRRMFPVLRVSVSGLEADAFYSISLRFEPTNGHTCTYLHGRWQPKGRDCEGASEWFTHPDSPNYGRFWMQREVSFAKVALSNKRGADHVTLQSLRQYQPLLRVIKLQDEGRESTQLTCSFPETQFVTVTAYQNEAVKALKVKHNPFAKAFLQYTGCSSALLETPPSPDESNAQQKRACEITSPEVKRRRVADAAPPCPFSSSPHLLPSWPHDCHRFHPASCNPVPAQRDTGHAFMQPDPRKWDGSLMFSGYPAYQQNLLVSDHQPGADQMWTSVTSSQAQTVYPFHYHAAYPPADHSPTVQPDDGFIAAYHHQTYPSATVATYSVPVADSCSLPPFSAPPLCSPSTVPDFPSPTMARAGVSHASHTASPPFSTARWPVSFPVHASHTASPPFSTARWPASFPVHTSQPTYQKVSPTMAPTYVSRSPLSSLFPFPPNRTHQ